MENVILNLAIVLLGGVMTVGLAYLCFNYICTEN